MALLLEINDGEVISGTDKLNELIQAANGIGGSLLETGQTYANQDAPYDRRRDTGAAGVDTRWLYDAGVLALQVNSGTEGVPVWGTILTIDPTNRLFSFADAGDTTGAEVRVYDGGADNKPGFWVLYDDAGGPHYLWFSTAGVLRTHTAKPTDDDADGTTVGTPGGSTTQAQYNNAGALGGMNNVTWNNATDTLTLGASVELDAGGATSLEVPNGTAPTVDAAGEVAVDTNGDGTIITQGILKFHDGTGARYVASYDTLPATDGHVLTYDGTAKKLGWEAGGGGGAPTDASYVVIGTNASLSAERTLAAGGGLTLTDGGAEGAATLAVGAGLGMTVNADDVALTTPGTLTPTTTNASTGNHTHAVTPGAPVSVKVANAEGDGASFARNNHTHAEMDVQALGTVGTNQTVDFASGKLATMTLSAAIQITLTSLGASVGAKVWLRIAPATFTPTWGGTNLKWPGGTAPPLSTGAADVDLLEFLWDGTNFNLVNAVFALA